jgi:hypothetical protein
MKKLKTLDEWKMLGKTMKLIHQKYLDELLPLLNGLPKQYWNNEWIKIDHHYNKLKTLTPPSHREHISSTRFIKSDLSI